MWCCSCKCYGIISIRIEANTPPFFSGLGREEGGYLIYKMKKTHQFWIIQLAVWLGAGLFSQICAQENQTSLQTLSQMVRNIEPAVYYECKITKKGISGFAEENIPLIELEWKECRAGYFYGKRSISRRGNPQNKDFSMAAWNKEGYFELSEDGLMNVQKNIPRMVDLLNTEDYLTVAYSFMIPTEEMATSIYPSLERIAKVKLDALSSHTKILDETLVIGGRTCNIGETEQGVDTWTGKPVKYRFYYDRTINCFPVGWDKMSAEGKLMTEYRVSEIGVRKGARAAEFRYPIKSTTTYYSQKSGKPTYTYGTHIEDVKIIDNESEINEDFLIDPSMAKYIYDTATKSLIPVPK